MNDNTDNTDKVRLNLLAVFDAINETEVEKKKLGEAITGMIENACQQLQMSKAGFKAALKWYNMSEGERKDFEKTMEQCKAVMAQCTQMDIFETEFGRAVAAASIHPEPRGGRREGQQQAKI